MYLFSNSEVYLRWTFFTYIFMFKLRSILQRDFLNRCIYFQTQKYTWSNLCIYVSTQKYTGSRFSKLMYFFNWEVYLKYAFNIDVFILKLQNYTWSRLSKFMYISSNPEIYLKQTLMYLFWNSEVYLKYTSFKKSQEV